MATQSWLSKLFGRKTERTSRGSRRGGPRRKAKTQLQLEQLEDRLTPSSYTGAGNSWMGAVQDGNLKLSQLSIPGTHDTMTYLATDFAEDQYHFMTLTEQLDAGIRFLDIRVGPNGPAGDLGLYHGNFQLFFSSFNNDVVKTCENFLTDHPTETIVMSIQRDFDFGNDSGKIADFRRTIDTVVGNHFTGSDKNFWYSFPTTQVEQDDFTYQPETKNTVGNVPTLAQARGKIVLLNGWDVLNWDGSLPAGDYGLPYPMYSGSTSSYETNPEGTVNGPRGYLSGENHWSIGSTPLEGVISQKETYITTALDAAQNSPVNDTSLWYITFTSTTGDLDISTLDIAEGGLSPDGGITRFLANQTFTGRVGTVLMDWVHDPTDVLGGTEDGVINKVIGANVFSAAPSDISLSNSSVPENKPAATVVGHFSTVGGDGSPTYKLDDSGDDAAFVIDGTGTLFTSKMFDFETKSSYVIGVRSTDAIGRIVDKEFTITVTDVNEAPTDITLDNDQVSPAAPVLTVIGSFNTIDQDLHDSHTYSLVPGAGDDDNSQFIVDAVGNLKTSGLWSSEGRSTYSILVQSTDQGGLSVVKQFTINLASASPTDITLSNSSVPEKAPAGTAVGTLSSDDPIPGDAFTYSLPSATAYPNLTLYPDHTLFTIDDHGVLRTAAVFDFEAQPSYLIDVRSTDGGGHSFDKEFTIHVTDVNDAPTDIALSNSSVPEDAPVGTVVGTFSTTDQDAGDTFTYQLTGAAQEYIVNSQLFTIDPSGQLRTATLFDADQKASYPIYVRSTDAGGLWVEKGFLVTITPSMRTPAVVALDADSLYNGAPHTATATATWRNNVLASDGSIPVDAGTLSYSYYLASDNALSSPLSGAPVQVGSYQVVAHYTSDQSRYTNADSDPVFFSITAAPLTVSPTAGQSKLYGAAVPTLTYTASGFVNNDPASTLTGDLGTTANSDSSVGSYDFTLGTLSAGSNSASGFVNSDPAAILSGALDTAAASAGSVGSYPFTLGTLSAGSNYTVSLAANSPTFAVTPALLTVSPSAGQSKLYGAPVPTLTYAASGFVNSDPAAILTGALDTAATSASSVGSYPFTLGTLSAGSNYTVSLAANSPTFAVTQAPLTITVKNATKIQGQANPKFTVSYSGFVLGEDASVLGGTLTFNTTATTSSQPGSYTITANGLTSSNYDIKFVSGTLTVISFAQATTNLQAQLDSSGLALGLQGSLDTQLQAAIALFNRGHKADAVSQLNAFISHVSAQSVKGVSATLASNLIASAQQIINAT